MANTTLEEPTSTETMELMAPTLVVVGEETCPVPGISAIDGAAPMEEVDLYISVLCCCCDLR